MRIFVLLTVIFGILFLGCIAPPPPANNTTIPPGYEVRDYCKADTDCVRLNRCCDCGLGVYVNKYNQKVVDCTKEPVCECAAIESRGECQDNKCVGVPVEQPPPPPPPPPIPPGYEVKDYCEKDSDCVRLNSCCDCGLGQYVNIYNQQPECPKDQPRCLCPIADSRGECQDNKCVAVSNYQEPPSEKITLSSGHGECGPEVRPTRTETENGTTLRGQIAAPNPCHFVSVQVKKVIIGEDYYYVLTLTTKPTEAEYCVQCVGAIPWEINITNYWGRVDIYYGGKKVFPDKAGFCGWSTEGACQSDADCVTGGCSGQVCQSKDEEPVITTCEYRECYDENAYGVGCGCVAGKCQWG
jgi:eight-cysteine-cluster-containing protein